MAEDIAILLEKMGYSYFKIDESINAVDIIVSIILGNEPRFVKAVPFIIYLSEKKHTIIFDIDALLKKAKQKNVLLEAKALLYAAVKILKIADKSNKLISKLERRFTKHEKDLADSVFFSNEHKQFNRAGRISAEQRSRYQKRLSRIYFGFDELLSEFLSQKTLYEAKAQLTLSDKLSMSRQQNLDYALRVLFKPKQLEIISKVADGRNLPKVEYDYYFKTIKKRLRAAKLLAEFADSIIQKKVSKG
ncbi:hypothetical protein HYX10_02240 [Candidatus Woesearchaeota archaeon]|nr:hypothetical protein [Candidatus Woesearchaeota archaeon]